VCALFDEATTASMRDAVDAICSESAFRATTDPLHVPLLGSLHAHSTSTVSEACRSAEAAHPQRLSGHFVRWQLTHSGDLRVVCVIDNAKAVLHHLRRSLPKSRTWEAAYVHLGSAAAIDPSQRAEFLAAVEKAFPIDPSRHFTLIGRLEFNEFNINRTTGDATTSAAHAARGPRAARTRKQRGRRKPQRRSVHMKWEREQCSDWLDSDPPPPRSSKHGKQRQIHVHQLAATKARDALVGKMRGLCCA